MVGKTSIIVTAYDHSVLLRKITSTCLACVNKHTNPEEYELILVDNGPAEFWELNTKEHLIKIDKHIKNNENLGCSKGNNQGAKIADPKSKYIAFLQSDVLVEENWLPRLRRYLETEDLDIVRPHQGPTPRDLYLKWENMSFEERLKERGNDDGGLILMTIESFKKTGGWDERFKYLWHDLGFRYRCSRAKLREKFAPEPVITHIGGAAAIADSNQLKKMYEIETRIVNKLREEYE